MKQTYLQIVDQPSPARRWRALLALGALSVLVACGGGDASDAAPGGLLGSAGPEAPSVSAITPDTAILGASTLFTVSGQNLPLTPVISMLGYHCQTPSNRTPTGFTAVCDVISTIGNDPILVRISNAGNDTTIDRSHSITVSATATFGGLTDTGITTCYSDDGYDHLGSCTYAQTIAFPAQQDAMFGRDVTAPFAADGMLGFSYSKVGAYAKSLCVRDNITGLMWEVKSDSSRDLRYRQNKYTNYGDNRTGDASAFVANVNATGLCGYSDWRLPNRHELQSLVNYGVPAGPPAIDYKWFPESLAAPYWSSSSGPKAFMRESSAQKFAIDAWYVSFATGVIHRDSLEVAHHVRLVR